MYQNYTKYLCQNYVTLYYNGLLYTALIKYYHLGCKYKIHHGKTYITRFSVPLHEKQDAVYILHVIALMYICVCMDVPSAKKQGQRANCHFVVHYLLVLFRKLKTENCADLEKRSNEVSESLMYSKTKEFDVSHIFYVVMIVGSVRLIVKMSDKTLLRGYASLFLGSDL